MRRGLPEREAGRHRGCEARGHHQRRARAGAHRRRTRGVAPMGGVLHAERGMHQGVRLRRQSALPFGHGAPRHGEGRQGAAGTAPAGRGKISRHGPRCERALAPAARWRGAGAARPEIGVGGKARRGAGLRVLYRLQCAEDAAYRAARPRHHGCARRLLPGDGRAEPLLRRHAAAHRRRRDVRAHGLEHDREAVALEFRPGDLLVPELLRPVHGNDAADDRTAARLAAVRDDAVPALPARPARRN